MKPKLSLKIQQTQKQPDTSRLAQRLLKVTPNGVILSESGIASSLTNTPSTHHVRPSGRLRHVISVELNESLREIHAQAQALYGPERAAYVLFRLTARDPSAQPPEWLQEAFKAHPEQLQQATEDAGE